MDAGIGVASGIAGLITIATQITKLIYSYTQDVRRATKNQKAYLSEISALTDVLLRFEDALQGAKQHLRADVSRPSDEMIQHCHEQLDSQYKRLEKHVNKFIWPLEVKEMRKAIEDVHRFREIFAGYVAAGTSSLVAATLSGVKALQITQGKDVILETLRHEALVFKARPEALSGTGVWLLHQSSYKIWVESLPSILWCYGAPGVGKSSLASIVIGDLYERQAREECYVLYHFCNFASRQQETEMAILQDLLSQIVEQGDDETIFQVYAKRHSISSHSSTPKEIVQIITQLSFKRPVYLVVDGLDEVEHAKRVASRLRFLVKTGFKVLVTSRDHPDIRAAFDQAITIEVHTDQDDIRSYVINRIEQSDFADAIDESHNLVDNLVSRADGLFILAKLLVDRILTCTNIKQMRRALEDSPATLSDAYHSSLERIQALNTSTRTLILRLISWIVNAERPFHSREIIHALALDPGEEEVDAESLTRLPTLLRNCVGLVVLNTKFGSLELVHTTAYEYFKNDEEAVKQVHNDIASTSLNYLSMKVFRDKICSDADEMSRWHKTLPFLGYAGRHWGVHAFKSGAEDRLYPSICLLLKHDNARSNSFLALFYQDVFQDRGIAKAVFSNVPTENTELHATAYWGLTNITKRLVDDGIDPNMGNSQGWRPLHWAAHNGHHKTCQVLVDIGADPNVQDERGWTPLFWSSFYCDVEGQKFFLENGTDHTIKDFSGWTALHWAVSKGEAESVKLLLLHHAQKYPTEALSRARNQRGELLDHVASDKLLEIAANEDDLDMFKILLQAHLDKEKPDFEALWTTGRFDPPLSSLWRTMNKAERCNGTESYLNSGFASDIHGSKQKDRWKGRLVHSAIKDDQLSSLKLLLELGADPNFKIGRSPLHAAALRQNPEYARLLLHFGADVKLEDHYGQTALHQAVLCGFAETVEALIEGGAGVNVRVGDCENRRDGYDKGRTPLMLACRSYEIPRQHSSRLAHRRKEIIKLTTSDSHAKIVDNLIAAGVDVTLLDLKNRSVLHYAVESTDVRLIEKILALGTKINQTDINGVSPLHLAAQTCNVHFVELLLNSGANPSQVDKFGRNCFHFFATGSDTEHDIKDLERLLGLLVPRSSLTLLNAEFDRRPSRRITWSSNDRLNQHTPLSLAIEAQNWKVFQIMADAGAVLPRDSMNLLENAVIALYTPAVSLILAHRLELKDERNKSCDRIKIKPVGWLRHAVSRKPIDPATFDDVTRQVQILIETDEDKKVFRDTMLHSAVSTSDSIELAAVLLKYGCNPFAIDDSGFDAFLICLLRQQNHIILQYLLLNAPNPIPAGNWIHYLKDLSDPQVDPLLSACEAIKASELLNHSPVKSLKLLKEAMKFKNEKLVFALIDVGTDCSTTDQYGWTILHHAIHQRQTNIANKLIQRYQSLIHVATTKWAHDNYRPTELRIGTKWTGTPLHLAVLIGEKDLVHQLLTLGVDVNARTDEYEIRDDEAYRHRCLYLSHGPTALCIALHQDTVYSIPPGGLNEDFLSMARLLLEFGADVGELGESLRLSDRPKFRLFEDVWEKVKGI